MGTDPIQSKRPRGRSARSLSARCVAQAPDFQMPENTAEPTIHDAYAALVVNTDRNNQIVADIIETVKAGRSPLVLTNRTDHLERLAAGLSDIENVLILKGGMGRKQQRAVSEKLASIRDGIPRVLLATGSTSAKALMIPDLTPCS
jgi:Lhr-like helicase